MGELSEWSEQVQPTTQPAIYFCRGADAQATSDGWKDSGKTEGLPTIVGRPKMGNICQFKGESKIVISE